MTTLYGIKNCDTVKKARRWLDENHINYQFHDFRVDGLTRTQLEQWIDELGWELIVNKRSTTWKALDETTKQGMNNQSVIAVILNSPTLIKRPLLDAKEQRSVGFTPSHYRALFFDK